MNTNAKQAMADYQKIEKSMYLAIRQDISKYKQHLIIRLPNSEEYRIENIWTSGKGVILNVR